MTDIVDEKPFYEQARARRAPPAPASRLPLYLLAPVAFIAGAIAFLATGKPEGGSIGAGPEALGYLIGYKGAGIAFWAAIIGGAICLILSTTQARKTGQRQATEDFLWPFLSAMAGGAAAFALILAIIFPMMAADEAARPIFLAHNTAMTQSGRDFDRDVMAINDGQDILSPKQLAADPGYRRATAKLEQLRAVVADHKQREADLCAGSRRKLAAAVSDAKQRKRLLAVFDADLARQTSLLDRYWTLQARTVENLARVLAILKTSPTTMQGGMIYFRRPADLQRFQVVQAEDRRDAAELEAVRQQLQALASQPPAR